MIVYGNGYFVELGYLVDKDDQTGDTFDPPPPPPPTPAILITPVPISLADCRVTAKTSFAYQTPIKIIFKAKVWY